MKTNTLILLFLLFNIDTIAQHSYRKDSLQIKVYSRLYVSKMLTIDSIKIKKVFCDFCTERQKNHFREEAYYRTGQEALHPKYRKPGLHKMALYIRISKKEFSKLK